MKNMGRVLLVVGLFAGSEGVYASESYGKSTTIVTTSVVKKIKKNLGKLTLQIYSSCYDSQKEADTAVEALKIEIDNKAQAEWKTFGMGQLSFASGSETVYPSSPHRYYLSYPDDNSTSSAFIDNCSDKVIALGDLEKAGGLEKVRNT